MERSAFFNSVNNDRVYNAQSFAEYFASFIANGVFPNPSNNLQVFAYDGFQLKVSPGKAWINGYFYVNDDDLYITLDLPDAVLSRIDAVVLRYSLADRNIKVAVKKGAFSSSPTPPTLQRDASIYELCLAQVYVAAGATSITQADITDTRLSTELCGIVHAVVDQVDTQTLWEQYESEFYTWFYGIQDILDESTAGNLLNMIESHINAAAPHSGHETPAGAQAKVEAHASAQASLTTLGHVKHAVLTVTLDTTWSETSPPYTKTVTVNGILASDTPIVDVVMSGTYATDEARIEQWGYVYRITTGDNSITAYATDKPTVELPIQIKVVR